MAIARSLCNRLFQVLMHNCYKQCKRGLILHGLPTRYATCLLQIYKMKKFLAELDGQLFPITPVLTARQLRKKFYVKVWVNCWKHNFIATMQNFLCFYRSQQLKNAQSNLQSMLYSLSGSAASIANKVMTLPGALRW